MTDDVRRRSKNGYHHGHLREELIRASVELIGERGTRAFSLREVARRIGVSHNAASHHFPSKRDVLIAVATAGFNLFAQALENASEDGPAKHPGFAADGARLVEMGMAYFRFSLEHPAYFRTMFGDALGNEKSEDPAFLAANARALAALYDNVRRALPEKSEEEIRDAGMYLWTHAHGITVLHIDNVLVFQLKEDENVEKFVENQIGHCVGDLLARG